MSHTVDVTGTPVITNDHGTTLLRERFGPFGEPWIQFSNTYITPPVMRKLFAGYNQEGPKTNFYYAGARFYSADLGRFLSQDPMQSSFANPKSLNPYAYARDNPFTLTDPTGMCAYDMPRPQGCGIEVARSPFVMSPGAVGVGLDFAAAWGANSITAGFQCVNAGDCSQYGTGSASDSSSTPFPIVALTAAVGGEDIIALPSVAIVGSLAVDTCIQVCGSPFSHAGQLIGNTLFAENASEEAAVPTPSEPEINAGQLKDVPRLSEAVDLDRPSKEPTDLRRVASAILT